MFTITEARRTRGGILVLALAACLASGNARAASNEPVTFGNTSVVRGNLGLSYGLSVGSPGTSTLEALSPVRTVAGASHAYVCGTDIFVKTRRSNSGAGMSDALPSASSPCLVNGAQLQIANTDVSASITVTAGSGTTINGASTLTIGPGRDVWMAYDATNTAWRTQANSASALLMGNNLSEVQSPSAARSNLGAAEAGANTSITSIGGLTTPLSLAQGGNGSATASGARANLGTAALGANTDITSIGGLTTPLSLPQGGVGSTNAAGARTNLGAAASGANTDITSLGGITGNVRVTKSANSDYTLGTKTGTLLYPVIMWHPGASAPAGANLAIDTLPLNSNPTDNSVSGNVWYDTCNSDLDNLPNPANCAHMGTFHNGDVTFGASAYFGQGTAKLFFPNNLFETAASPDKHDLYEQTYADEASRLYSRGAMLRGTGSTVDRGLAVEEPVTNLLLASNSFTPGTWSFSSASWAGSGVESPDGGTSAALVTSTSSGGSTSQNLTISATSLPYVFAEYVSSASAAASSQLNAAFANGGAAQTTALIVNPATGALSVAGTTPTDYGAEKITVGCQTGCASQETTWWRIWFLINSPVGDTGLTVTSYPSGFSGSAASALLWGAQAQIGNRLTGYVASGAAAVTKPLGTPIVPVNAKSINLYGALLSTGAAPVLSTGACVGTSWIGNGPLTGVFSAPTCAGTSLIISGLPTAPHGYSCVAQDETTPANTLKQQTYSATSCTFLANTTSGDFVVVHEDAF